MAFQVHAVNYDLKQDNANVTLVDQSRQGHAVVTIQFPLKTGDGLKEGALEARIVAEAKKLLQEAIQVL
jgi:hypothetical protein